MGKSCLTTIESRAKLRTTTKHPSNRNNKRPNMGGETFAHDSAQHNITIPARAKGGALILKQFLQNTTTPLQRGGKKARGLKNKGKI